MQLTYLASLHQTDDSCLVDKLAVLVDSLKDLGCLCLLLGTDGLVKVDTNLLRLEV